MYRIRQTDCRTGWQIITPAGRVYLTVRRREEASRITDELNRAS